MVGKNNQKERTRKSSQKVYKYAIKRLSIGVASVAVAASLRFASGPTVVQAQEPNGETNVETTTRSVDELPSRDEEATQPEETTEAETPAVVTEKSTDAPASPQADKEAVNAADKEDSNLADHEVAEQPAVISSPDGATADSRSQALDTFAEKVLSAKVPKAVIASSLEEVYGPKDAAAIAELVRLDKVSNGQELMKAITEAGVEFAKRQGVAGRAQIFVGLPNNPAVQTGENRDISSKIKVNTVKFTRPNGDAPIKAYSGEAANLYFDVKVPDDVKAGDFFVVNYGNQVRPGGLEIPIKVVALKTKEGVAVADPIYDAENNRTIYKFNEWVNNRNNIVAYSNESVWPKADAITDNNKDYPVTVTVANNPHTENLRYDYGDTHRYAHGATVKVDQSNPQKYRNTQVWYINRFGAKVPGEEHSIFIESATDNLESKKLYEVLDDHAFTDSHNPDFNPDSAHIIV